jgi:hypothetical protein
VSCGRPDLLDQANAVWRRRRKSRRRYVEVHRIARVRSKAIAAESRLVHEIARLCVAHAIASSFTFLHVASSSGSAWDDELAAGRRPGAGHLVRCATHALDEAPHCVGCGHRMRSDFLSRLHEVRRRHRTVDPQCSLRCAEWQCSGAAR